MPEAVDEVDWEGTEWTEERLAALAERIPLGECRITVAHDLAPLVDGGELDFGPIVAGLFGRAVTHSEAEALILSRLEALYPGVQTVAEEARQRRAVPGGSPGVSPRHG